MAKLGITAGIIVIAILGAVIFFSQGESGEKAQKGDVPALAFKDYEGSEVALQDFQGRPHVLNSWAVWCPFCVKELQDFVALQNEFPEITIVAIDRAESLQTAKSYTDNLGISDDLVFLLDPSDSFYRAIGGFSMPETLFIDSEGKVQVHKRGPMDLQEMREKVQTIL